VRVELDERDVGSLTFLHITADYLLFA
jgi:hypothetical protein